MRIRLTRRMSRWIFLPLHLLRLLFAGAGTVVIWILWLALLILAVYQASIVIRREFVVPDWVRAKLVASLAESGLTLSSGTVSFDPTGRAVIQDVVISELGTNEPLLSVRAAALELDPLLLLTRRVEIHAFEFSGVSLHLPAIRSPSGRNEAVLESLAGRITPSGGHLTLHGVSGRFAGVEFTLSGSLLSPGRDDQRDFAKSARTTVRELRAAWVRTAQKALEALPQIEGIRAPKLAIDITQTRPRTYLIRGEAWAEQVSDEPARRISVAYPRALAQVALNLDGESTFTLTLSTPRANLPSGISAERLAAQVHGRFAPGSLQPRWDRAAVSAALLTRGPVALRHATLHTAASGLASNASFVCAGEPWEVAVETCDLAAGRLRGQASGRLNAEHLRLVEALSGRAIGPLLQLASTPRLAVQVSLDDGWKLRTASGWFAAGPVTARGVPLDGASAAFRVNGTQAIVEDIVLRQGPSLAQGTYLMDLSTRDFRFLLNGSLQPMGISGWFKDWWPRFWANFDFSEQLPTADVDVRGRWGSPAEITVYVGAQNGRTSIRGTLFDSISTRVFVRPHFYDVRYFHATQGKRAATGQFHRLIDPQSRVLSELAFSATSDLDLTEGARVLGDEIEAVVAPFRMSRPPRLEIAGKITGPAAPEGPGRQFNINASSTGDFLFYDFPLSGVSAVIAVHDDDIVVDPVTAGFAGGQATGRIHLSGRDADQRLGFDIRLRNAVLGQSIRNLEEFSARRNRQPAPQENRFQQRIAAGQLDLALSADGRFADLFSYQGEGNLELTGADLGEVRLLWVLSELLDKAFLNFSTLKLDTVRANFALEGRKLAFSDVRITGPRAAIEAQGDYALDRKSLEMKAKLFPFEESKSLFGTAAGLVFSPFSQALEFRLTGPLDKPSWAFVFGPTSMLRTITGSGRKEPDPTP